MYPQNIINVRDRRYNLEIYNYEIFSRKIYELIHVFNIFGRTYCDQILKFHISVLYVIHLPRCIQIIKYESDDIVHKQKMSTKH